MRVLGPALAALLLAGCLGSGGTPSQGAHVATGRIDGAVVDGLLNPYPYQNVTLVNLGLVDQTSRLGGFTFRDVPAGTYTLVSQKAGTDGDVKVVEVRPGQITRVILQMLAHHDPLPTVSKMPHSSYSDLPQPGTACAECAWSTFVLEQPKEIVLDAAWTSLGDGLPSGGNALTLKLATDDGTVLASATGTSPLELATKDRLPSQQRLNILVDVPSDFVPQPLQVNFLLSQYYVADRAHQAATA